MNSSSGFSILGFGFVVSSFHLLSSQSPLSSSSSHKTKKHQNRIETFVSLRFVNRNRKLTIFTGAGVCSEASLEIRSESSPEAIRVFYSSGVYGILGKKEEKG